jgi:peptide/nickel transport system permease protein
MTNYVARRLFQTLLTLLALSFITYVLMGWMPGDPLDIACAANPKCTMENLDQMKQNLGLDRPIHERYATWAWNFARGELGYSRIYRRPVAEILLPRLWNSIVLGTFVMVFSLLVAIPIGVYSSLHPNTKLDYGVNLAAFSGISAPSFWLGLMFIILFSVKLRWLPAGGTETIGIADEGSIPMLLDRLKYLVLPVASLSCMTIASWVRYTRASMLETLRFDFIRTARAKGLSPSRVIVRHALRNALLPIVTVVAMSAPMIVSGAIITETVFAYQGIGKLMYDSIMGNDFNVAMCSFVISCFMVLIMNLAADLAYAYLDPRITYK